MTGVPVTLTWPEFVMAAQVGMARFISARTGQRSSETARRRPTYLGQLSDDINGACGELAYCKHFGLYWDGSVGRFHAEPDIPQHNSEIRTTIYPTGHLIVEQRDKPAGRWFVLVTGSAPQYVIRGRIPGEQATHSRFDHLSTGGVPEWWVPQEALETP